MIATTRSAVTIESVAGSQWLVAARNIARASGMRSDGRTPATKWPIAYTSATARRRRTASESRSGGRLHALLRRSAADRLPTSRISVFFESASLGMGWSTGP